MKTFGDAWIVACFLVIFFFIGTLVGGYLEREIAKEIAVENSAAYWCIEDHKKVFSWEKCE